MAGIYIPQEQFMLTNGTNSSQATGNSGSTSTTTGGSNSSVSSTQIGDALGSGIVDGGINFIEQGIQTGDWGAAAANTAKQMSQQIMKSLLKEGIKSIAKLLLGKTDLQDATSSKAKAAKTQTADLTAQSSKAQKLMDAATKGLESLMNQGLGSINTYMSKMDELAAGANDKVALCKDQQARQSELAGRNEEILEELNNLGFNTEEMDKNPVEITKNDNGKAVGRKFKRNFSNSVESNPNKREINALLKEYGKNSTELLAINETLTTTFADIETTSTEIEDTSQQATEEQSNYIAACQQKSNSQKTTVTNQITSDSQTTMVNHLVDAGIEGAKAGIDAGEAAAGEAASVPMIACPYTTVEGEKLADVSVKQGTAGGIRGANAGFKAATSAMLERMGKSLINKGVNAVTNLAFKGIEELAAQDPTGTGSAIVGELKSFTSSSLSGAITDEFPKQQQT